MQEKEILLVRQRHEADRAGLHFDYRIVLGDKAYSWATKKDLPEPGKCIILHEQPVHDTKYALSKKVVIPKGQYGAGVTTLDKAWKGKARIKPDEYLLHLHTGERFLIKHLPKYGNKQWLFYNITGIGLDKKAEGALFGSKDQDYNYPQPDAKFHNIPATEQEKKDSRKDIRNVLLTLKGNLRRVGITKSAAVKPKQEKPVLPDNAPSMQRHQNRVVEKLKGSNPRLLAFHGMGSGKTKTGLVAAQNSLRKNPKGNVLIITPAGLTKNFDKEQKKHHIKLDKSRVTTLSYEKAVKQKDKLLEKDISLLIADEAHKLRETDTTRYKELEPLFRKAKDTLLLSGSPLYNEPKNMSTLVNLLAKSKVLPEKTEDFEQAFVNKKQINPGLFKRLFLGVKPSTRRELKNQAALQKVLGQYIDYYEPENEQKAFYPRVNETEVKVPLSSEQQQVYDFLEGNLPGPLKWKIRMGLPPDKRESTQLNAFASGLRQVSNSHGPFKKGFKADTSASPKLERAASNLVSKLHGDKNFRGLVYSNYLKAGVEPYKAMLDKMGVKSESITGELTAKDRARIVKDYNSGKLKVLFISSAGGEGLDLKGTKLIQVMEPHWNEEKIKQVIGRGVRYKSHAHLPPEEQQVEVEHYLSTVKQTLVDKLFKVNPKSIDEYLRDRSKDKSQFNNQIKDLLRENNNKQGQ
jgi:superfamily II DNA or RNA helicase